ncbi:MAG: hypothetical protein WC634_01700 [archaeon]
MKKTYLAAIVLAFLIVLPALQSASAEGGVDIAYLLEVTDTSFLPSTIYAGSLISLAVDVKNNGSFLSITDLNATLDIGDDFEAIDAQDGIAVISKASTKTLIFKFRVKEGTSPGYYPATVKMSYLRGDTGMEITTIQEISIPVSKTDKTLDVTVAPTVINPGNQTQMVFTVKNVGGTAVSNIAFSWAEANNLILPLGSDNRRYISVLKPGEAESVDYLVAADPNIATGIYPLDITLTFMDSDGTRTQSSQVGLILGGKTDFEVSAEMLSTGQVSISLANIGSNNADAVVVKIPNQAGIRVSGSNTSILGNLNKGDFTLANFELQTTAISQGQPSSQGPPSSGTDPSSAGRNFGDTNSSLNSSRQLVIQIDYTDTTGERQSVQKTVQLSSSSSSETTGTSGMRTRSQDSSLGIVAWALLAVLAGGAIAFNRFKAGNKNWKRLAMAIGAITAMFLVAIFLLGSGLIAVVAATVLSLALLAWFFRPDKVKGIIWRISHSIGKAKK